VHPDTVLEIDAVDVRRARDDVDLVPACRHAGRQVRGETANAAEVAGGIFLGDETDLQFLRFRTQDAIRGEAFASGREVAVQALVADALVDADFQAALDLFWKKSRWASVNLPAA